MNIQLSSEAFSEYVHADLYNEMIRSTMLNSDCNTTQIKVGNPYLKQLKSEN